MATDVVMPQMGESIAEGTITRWLVEVGQTVERDEPLFEISTDKVDAEIPSPSTGVLLEVKAGAGDTVPVNQVVAYIGEEGESVGEVEAAEPKADGTGETSVLDEEDETLATMRVAKVGEGEPGGEGADDDDPTQVGGQAPSTDGDEDLAQRLRRVSSPLVRNIAAKEGVDITRLKGTGIHGRVTKQDILGHLEDRKTGKIPPAPAAPAPAASPAPARTAGSFSVPAYLPSERVEVEPMSKIRQITADHMVYSKATSAHVTTVFHVDMSRVDSLRRRAKTRFQEANGTKLTFMPFIFRAVAKGLKSYRQLNAAIDGTDIVYKKDVNLGMAVALDHGLIVPVLKNADGLSLVGLAKTANDLADRSRTKRLKPDEVQGGTFTVTNPGVFGSLFGTPVINQPQVAILGVGTIEKRPVVISDGQGGDALGIRTMCYFALTFDHRLIDGADADRFMADFKATLETDDWSELEPYL